MYTKTAPLKTMHHLLNVVLQITMRFIQGFYLSDQNFEFSASQQIETEKLSVKTAPSTHTESWQYTTCFIFFNKHKYWSVYNQHPSHPEYCIIVILWAVVTEWQGFILYHHCEFEVVS